MGVNVEVWMGGDECVLLHVLLLRQTLPLLAF